MFVDTGFISEDCMDEIIKEYESHGGSLDEILMEKGNIDEKILLNVIAVHHRTTFVPLEKLVQSTFRDGVLKKIPSKVAKKYGIFPIAYSEKSKTLKIITHDPGNMDAIMVAESADGVRKVKVAAARSRTINLATRIWYDRDVDVFDDLSKEGFSLDEKAFLSVIAAHLKTRFVTLERLKQAAFSDELLRMVPSDIARKHTVFPIAYDRRLKSLTVISPDVNNIDAITELERAINVNSVTVCLSRSKTVKIAIKRWYDKDVDAFIPGKERENGVSKQGPETREKVLDGDPASIRKPEGDAYARKSREAIRISIERGYFKCIFCSEQHSSRMDRCPETGKSLSPIQKLSFTILEEKYKVKDLIGEGGMGNVYEGEHMGIRKRLAIKFLNPSLYRSQESIARFKREARAAATITHKNIVDVTDIGTTSDGIPYIIMELLEGEDLADRLDRKKRLELTEAIAIMVQVLEALAAVHSCSIIHRDLKPENIFIARQSGGSEIVKVLDFRISRLTGLEDESMRITQEGRIYGTPHYVAPEQAQGRIDTDHRTDLYSVGTIFYEMITGKPPFDAASYPELLTEIIRTPIPDLAKRFPDLPPAIVEFVNTGLAKKPEERFQSAQEMLDVINNIQTELMMSRSSSLPALRVSQIFEEGKDTEADNVLEKDTMELEDL